MRGSNNCQHLEGEPNCFGFCQQCNMVHSLPEGPARLHCQQLMEELDSSGRIDFERILQHKDMRLSTDYLFGKARGQMFGVLVTKDQEGNEVVLKAFSGQYNGIWQVKGWAPPLLSVEEFEEINTAPEKAIKDIGREIDSLSASAPHRKVLIKKRKQLSQQLMKDIHGLYRLNNFRGQQKTLEEVFIGTGGMPTGTGDCCAPKLLNMAAVKGLTPIGLAEFYYGKENPSASRHHKKFYPSCQDKCQPILGFLLCGIDT